MERDFKKMGRAELTDMLHTALKDKDKLEQECAEYLRRAQTAAQHMEETEKRAIAVQNELTVSKMEAASLQEKSASMEAQIQSLQSQLDSAREQLTAAQKEIEKERIRSASLSETLREEQSAHVRTQEKNESLAKQLSDRVILKDNAGTLADAAIQINGVLAAAQTAADQYLENIERLHREQEKSCAAMEAESREKAAQMIRDAEARCDAMETQTKAKCEALKADAEKNVWQKWSSLSEQLKQISNEIHNTVHVPD